jgi:uncharacterized protein
VRREVLDPVVQYLDLRRAGKSTLARQAINHLIHEKGLNPRHILFLNLETPQFSRYRNDITALERAFEDYLKLATPEETVYCFLDEVHFFPEWQVFVKSRYEQRNVRFIVTGSNSRLLSSEFITLLSGQALPVVVHPFSFTEFPQARGIVVADEVTLLVERHMERKTFDDYLRFGAFPEIAFLEDETVKRDILVMYVRNII